MPVYAFQCLSCGEKNELVRSVEARGEPSPCPVCTLPMERDIRGEYVHSTDQGYQRPIYSEAAGVHPSQVQEAKRHFPDHEFTPDGRMVFRSHAQRKRQLRELGMRDNDSYG